MSLRVATMRWIDRHVGIPLCAIATLCLWLTHHLLPARKRPDQPREVLFIELSEMGSAILADPAMRRAQAQGANIHFLIFANNRVSLELLDTVKRTQVMVIDPRNLLVLARSSLAFLIEARRRRIDCVIDLELFSRFTALLSGLSGATCRVGFHRLHGEGLWRGDMLTHRVLYNPHQHIAKNFLALVHAAFSSAPEVPYSKITIPDEWIRLTQARVDDHERAIVHGIISRAAQSAGQPVDLNAARLGAAGMETAGGVRASDLRPLVLINPNASELLPQRCWPAERFAALIQQASQRWPEALFLITGSEQERHYAESIRTAAGGATVNLAGCLAFGQLPALYCLARVMVTNDSGPAHFAAVTPLPTIVLFGPETPDLYRSLGSTTPITASLACSPCVSAANHRRTACDDNACMRAITVERVLNALTPFMTEGTHAHA